MLTTIIVVTIVVVITTVIICDVVSPAAVSHLLQEICTVTTMLCHGVNEQALM